MGSPSKKEPTIGYNFNMSVDLYEMLEDACRDMKVTKKHIMIQALTEWLKGRKTKAKTA